MLSVLFESIRFFKLIPPQDFLFGLEWNPQFEGAERAGLAEVRDLWHGPDVCRDILDFIYSIGGAVPWDCLAPFIWLSMRPRG